MSTHFYPSMKFHPGGCYATPAALRAIEAAGQEATHFLDRHVVGDWGGVCPEDARANDEALKDGSRLLSSYHTLLGQELWVITEAASDQGVRESTTILLPEEY